MNPPGGGRRLHRIDPHRATSRPAAAPADASPERGRRVRTSIPGPAAPRSVLRPAPGAEPVRSTARVATRRNGRRSPRGGRMRPAARPASRAPCPPSRSSATPGSSGSKPRPWNRWRRVEPSPPPPARHPGGRQGGGAEDPAARVRSPASPDRSPQAELPTGPWRTTRHLRIAAMPGAAWMLPGRRPSRATAGRVAGAAPRGTAPSTPGARAPLRAPPLRMPGAPRSGSRPARGAVSPPSSPPAASARRWPAAASGGPR